MINVLAPAGQDNQSASEMPAGGVHITDGFCLRGNRDSSRCQRLSRAEVHGRLSRPLNAYASATVFSLRLSRSKAAAQELIGANFLGILICDRYGAYNCLPLEQRQFCWAHLRRDLIAMAERSGVSEQIGRALLGLQSQLFESWHAWLDQRISRAELEASSTDIRQAFQAKLEWAVNLGCSPGETTPLARTIGTCRKLLNSLAGLWTFLFHPEVELTNNASERALRPVVIARKLSTGVQSAWGGEFLGRIMSMATTLEQQGREGIEFLMELINANREGRPSPSLIPVSS